MARNIVFAPGAEENEVAVWLHDNLRARIFSPGSHERSWRRNELEAMRATVGFVANDRRVSATLRIDRGAVVVHDGSVGAPDITFFGSFDTLRAIAALPLSRAWHLPVTAPWGSMVAKLAGAELKIFGLVTHPRLAVRIARLLALD